MKRILTTLTALLIVLFSFPTTSHADTVRTLFAEPHTNISGQWHSAEIKKIIEYATVHTSTLILLAVFLLALLGLGLYKLKQKKISRNSIIVGMAFSGGAALIYEVAATQALTYFFNSSSYSVATAIVSFLLGLALGSFIVSHYLPKITNPIKTLMLLQVGAGLYALFVLPQYGHLLSITSFLYDAAAGSAILILSAKFLIGIVFLLLPTMMLGASFPLASSLIIKDIKTAGSDVGQLYAWDLIGAVLGALISGFILLPIFGLTISFVFGAVINIVAGVLLSTIGKKKMWLALLATAIFIPLITFAALSQNVFSVGFNRGSLDQVMGKDVLFIKESAYGQIMVTNVDNAAALAISKIVQCDISYPLLLKNLNTVLATVPENARALDIGLGCGYSSSVIASNSKIHTLDIVEINPVLTETLKYFKNDGLLQNNKVALTNDDAMHFIARTQNTYDLVNVELNMPSLPQVSPFYSVEYFRLLKQKIARGGTLRLWVCCGNYEFVKAVYKTLHEVFPHIIIKTDIDPREGSDYLFDTEFIVSDEAQLVEQTPEEKQLQARIVEDKNFVISTLDNQLIGTIWYNWTQSKKTLKNYFVQPAKPSQDTKSVIKNTYVFPLDVKPGDEMSVGARVIDSSGVVSVRASFPHEKGEDWVGLKLVEGTQYDGTWQGTWIVHDTLDKGYTTIVTAMNTGRIQSKFKIHWTDIGPACIDVSFNNTIPYTANVGSTFNVSVTRTGITGCTTGYILDNTGGSYAIVPATDTDLDCNGATCSDTTFPFTKTLKCENAGVYNLRASNNSDGSGDLHQDTTVTCSAVGGAVSPTRVMRLFEGLRVKLMGGRVIIRQK